MEDRDWKNAVAGLKQMIGSPGSSSSPARVLPEYLQREAMLSLVKDIGAKAAAHNPQHGPVGDAPLPSKLSHAVASAMAR